MSTFIFLEKFIKNKTKPALFSQLLSLITKQLSVYSEIFLCNPIQSFKLIAFCLDNRNCASYQKQTEITLQTSQLASAIFLRNLKKYFIYFICTLWGALECIRNVGSAVSTCMINHFFLHACTHVNENKQQRFFGLIYCLI